jgi:hypothetical protein
LGDAGGAINNAVTAFAQGGPIAAIASFAASLITRTQAFGKLSKTLSEIFGALVEAINPIVAVVADLATALAGPLKVVMHAFGFAVKAWAAVVRVVLLGHAYVVKGIAGLWNGIVGAISAIFKKIGSLSLFGAHPLAFLKTFGETIDKAKINMDGLNRTLSSLNGSMSSAAGEGGALGTAGEADAIRAQLAILRESGTKYADEINYLTAKLAQTQWYTMGEKDLPALHAMYEKWSKLGGGAFKGVADAIMDQMIAIETSVAGSVDHTNHSMDRLSRTVEKLNKEMTNVPQGFKDTLYRFNATVAGMTGSPGERRTNVNGGDPNRQQMVNHFYIDGSGDPAMVANEVVRTLERRSVRISGSSVSNMQSITPAKNTRVRQFG